MPKRPTTKNLLEIRDHSIMMLDEYIELIDIIGGNEETLIKSMFLGFSAESVGASRVTFYFFDNSNKLFPNVTLTYKNNKIVPYDYYSELKDVIIDLGKDICGLTAETKKPIFIPDIKKEKRYKGIVDKKIKLKINSLISIPLLIDNQVYGIVEVANAAHERYFTLPDFYIVSTIARMTMITMEKAKLYSWSVTDNLTQVYNYQYLQISLEKELTRSKRYTHNFSVLLIDVDNFKHINDKYGHYFGNTVLKEIAVILKNAIRKNIDLPVRYGGDEFLLLLPETDIEGAKSLAKRLIDNLNTKDFISDNNETVKASISIGVTSAKRKQIIDKDKLIKTADEALYMAKREGKNRFVILE